MNDTRTSAIRVRLQAERSAISPDDRIAASLALADRLLRALESTASTVVAGYLPHGGEIDLGPTLARLRATGRNIVLPRCGANASMVFCSWGDGDELVENRYGIGEPTSDPVDDATIGVALVPGVGFSKSGDRIGHGVGFYDRWFARVAATGARPWRIGVAHDLQIVELASPEPWDVSMDAVATPTRWFGRPITASATDPE